MLLSGICLSVLSPGVVEVLNKTPDIDTNNNIIYQYEKTVYAKPDAENTFVECQKAKSYKITLPVKNMNFYIKKID
jgi:hypothetical protein